MQQDASVTKDGGAKTDAGAGHDGGASKSDSGAPTDDGGAPVAPPQVPAGWTLALNDDFDGPTLSANWGVGTNLSPFTVNGTEYWEPYTPQEAEYLTGSQVSLASSTLSLTAMSAPAPVTGPKNGTKSFISGYVTTYGKFQFQYGYIEYRAKMPDCTAGSMTGLWPALWLLNSTYANSDEIDVVESYGADQTSIQMTAQPSNSVTLTITPGYHVFAVLHTATTIAFYVDNQLQKSFTQSMSSEMAILMGLQLGSSALGWISPPVPSNWGGGVDGPMTADLDIDWVHVWTP
jgi:beta-glucanase (GH16 family)